MATDAEAKACLRGMIDNSQAYAIAINTSIAAINAYIAACTARIAELAADIARMETRIDKIDDMLDSVQGVRQRSAFGCARGAQCDLHACLMIGLTPSPLRPAPCRACCTTACGALPASRCHVIGYCSVSPAAACRGVVWCDWMSWVGGGSLCACSLSRAHRCHAVALTRLLARPACPARPASPLLPVQAPPHGTLHRVSQGVSCATATAYRVLYPSPTRALPSQVPCRCRDHRRRQVGWRISPTAVHRCGGSPGALRPTGGNAVCALRW